MALEALSSSEDTVPRATSRLGTLVGYGLPILAFAAAVVAAFITAHIGSGRPTPAADSGAFWAECGSSAAPA
jgi:hypothetical protein